MGDSGETEVSTTPCRFATLHLGFAWWLAPWNCARYGQKMPRIGKVGKLKTKKWQIKADWLVSGKEKEEVGKGERL